MKKSGEVEVSKQFRFQITIKSFKSGWWGAWATIRSACAFLALQLADHFCHFGHKLAYCGLITEFGQENLVSSLRGLLAEVLEWSYILIKLSILNGRTLQHQVTMAGLSCLSKWKPLEMGKLANSLASSLLRMRPRIRPVSRLRRISKDEH
jgi:hypothetical protein